MKMRRFLLLIVSFCLPGMVWASDLYVWTNSPHPGVPYNAWTNAARTIQAAINYASANDVIWVTNGTYNTGGSVVYGMSNRVALTKALKVQSVNGPSNTFIVGVGPNGSAAMRCAYVTSGATLSGFTLTNGYGRLSGDIYKEQGGAGAFVDVGGTVTACRITGNVSLYGGGALCFNGGTLIDCTIRGNQVGDGGGGVYCFEGGTLTRCTIGENGANDGGGMYFDGGYGSASNCTIIGNTVGGMGGGVYCQGGGTTGAQLCDCTIESNTAWEGGGVCAVNAGAEFYHCTIQGNWADNEGGGVLLASTETTSGGVLWYCVITDNESPRGGGVVLGADGAGHGGDAVSCIIAGNDAADGGGVYAASVGGGNPGSVAWCTIAGNIATNAGGGIYWNNSGSAHACIIYDNDGGNWYQVGSGMSYNYCCTTPLAGLPNPSSCIDADPQFVNAPTGDYHLSYGSPCIDAGGSAVGTVTNDLDGDPRPIEGDYSNPTYTDIGADEYNAVTADSDGDTMLDDWEHRYSLNPTNAADAAGHADVDGINNRDEHTADTCPTNSQSFFHLTGAARTNSFAVEFVCTNSRAYSLQYVPEMVTSQWQMVDGATNVPGVGSSMSLTDTVDSVQRSYRVGVSLP